MEEMLMVKKCNMNGGQKKRVNKNKLIRQPKRIRNLIRMMIITKKLHLKKKSLMIIAVKKNLWVLKII